jgi:hypothetical protein
MKNILPIILTLILFISSKIIWEVYPDANYPYPSVNYSPFLNTKFYEVYKDIKIVQKAYKEGIISLEILEYLYSQNNPIHIKSAIINSFNYY